ncbi:cob(I)yrinic acid a,c-diamide adenosyltransferase [Peptoniphilus sp. KCTC 25270]|uniref:cob(I)yrinic acid a,c-diamide adenosyltransferase n=1 Tax=Peptoniphilus sp. KCTC 25270 TaxID=2897414 RepID=UPI001E5B2FC8|nr:cob(I)yrinic acid a,c-diamide adenosyltransferase [Peptoniphilus sp. KCTC 25270]MCD1146772.1 cob(I)yrinic acid a,c-diamide adenosyltransferase [Peptoniphilus sp. KCTC 25270]
MEIYTKTGDKGTTSLYDGVRVGKDDARVESYGTVDELGAALGVAVNYMDDEVMIGEIRGIQNKLFVVNENLATEDQSFVRHHIIEEDIVVLEKMVDKYMAIAGEFDGFVINGTSKAAAHLHLARTICRRAERRIVAFDRIVEVDPLVKKFVNRLADTIYAFARACEAEKISVNFERELFIREDK